MLPSHLSLDLSRIFLPLCSPAITLYTFFFPYVLHILPIFSSFIWSPAQYQARSRLQIKSPLIRKSLPGSVASSLWGPNVSLDTQFSNTLSLFFPYCPRPSFTSIHIRRQITVLHVSAFSLSHSIHTNTHTHTHTHKHKKIRTEW